MATDFKFQDSVGFAWILSNITWDVFASVTFGTVKDRAPRRAYSHVWAHFHEVAKFCRVPYSHLLIALRGEFGEHGGPFHFHYLIGGTHQRNIVTLCHQIKRAWNLRTGAREKEARPYDRSLAGPEYITKCLVGSNAYELGKYDLACEVTLSRSVFRVTRSIARFRADATTSAADKMGARRGLQVNSAGKSTPGLDHIRIGGEATVQPALHLDTAQALMV